MLPIPIEKMEGLIRQKKDLVVKIGDRYEISRPLALELWKLMAEEVIKAGGTIRESVKVEYASDEMVVVSLSVSIRLGKREMSFCEIGEGYRAEKSDTMARVAFTRAMKRLLERIAGEDFINKVILSLFGEVEDVPATERQKELIRKLLAEGKITDKVMEKLKDKLPQDFDLAKALQENALTFSQARAILDEVVGKR